MKQIDKIYQLIIKNKKAHSDGFSAQEIAETLSLDRANVSRYLNQLYLENKLVKIDGRPVRYMLNRVKPVDEGVIHRKYSLDLLIGAEKSLIVPIQQAKAAILYPPRGLHTLILGNTGVGKSMFAELMYAFAIETEMIDTKAPFIRFNCADYAENPQLLVSQIFGVKKGAYTGADKDREGLLKKADKGILFLDEVHRLSSQGQEMLFTFIDKGYFRKLGDSEDKVYSEVQIIAATTEEPESTLLSTFTRRIPMTIKLPNLKERGLKDRYRLVEVFLKEESKRLQKSIYINKIALESFLLYDCPSNIGQLKSDLQLSCAKAFLNFRSQKKNYILIEQSDLPSNVKKGHLLIKNYRRDMDHLLKHQEDIFKFYFEESETYLNDDELMNTQFYDSIEQKLETLQGKGMSLSEINELMRLDIEKHFQRYITEIPRQFKMEELSRIVHPASIEVARKLLDIASQRLNKVYDEKVYLGLALHLHSSIERIKSGKEIYHPKLNDVRVNHSDAFLLAMELAKIVDASFDVATPLDEIGYLAMFFASEVIEDHLIARDVPFVHILVIMHGKSTASSMAEVANELLGTDHCVGIDMPLSLKPEDVYQIAKQHLLKMENSQGVLMMVDMGSLVGFSDMLHEETGVLIRSIERVSTPLVLEAARKALMGRDLMEIYKSINEMTQSYATISTEHAVGKKNLIVTACFTGEGASEKLKKLLLKELAPDETCEIISLNIVNRNEFMNLINYYRTHYHLLAIVSTVDISIPGIPFLSALDILSGVGMDSLQTLLKRENIYNKIGDSLKAHLKMADSEMLLKQIRNFIEQTELGLKVNLPQDVKIGIALHLSFLVDNLIQGFVSNKREDFTTFKNQYPMEMSLIKEYLWQIQQTFSVRFREEDRVYLCKMFLENHIHEIESV